MSVKTMACTSCWRTSVAYPDGFPDRTFAVCWQCTWNQHVHSEHPKTVKRIKRVAAKRAKRLAERDVLNAMFGNELDQVIGVAAAEAHRAAKRTTAPPATRPNVADPTPEEMA